MPITKECISNYSFKFYTWLSFKSHQNETIFISSVQYENDWRKFFLPYATPVILKKIGEISVSPKRYHGVFSCHSAHITESSDHIYALHDFFRLIQFHDTIKRLDYHESIRRLSNVRIPSCNHIMALEIRIATSDLNRSPVYLS